MVKKTFIKTGLTYIDLGPLCSFRFTSDPEGYVNCHFYFLSRETPVIVKIPNRNELAELFVALDQYFDGTLQESLNALIDQINAIGTDNPEDDYLQEPSKPPKKKRNRRNGNKNKKE